MNIIVDLDYQIQDGSEVVFRSPVDCSQVTGLLVNHTGGSKEFMFADAHGNNVGDIDHLFVEDVVVKVILDVTTGMAFVQNADTNAYLEGRFASMPMEVADKLCPTFTESGAVVACEPFEGTPLEVVSGIVPTQEGSGDPSPDNVRPINGHTAVNLSRYGKNLLNPAVYGLNLGSTTTLNGDVFTSDITNLAICVNPVSPYYSTNCGGTLLPKGTYTATVFPLTEGMRCSFYIYSVATKTEIKAKYNVSAADPSFTFTADEDFYFAVGGSEPYGVYSYRLQIEAGRQSTEYAPFMDVETFTFDLGQTVYGGSLNWKTGVLTISYANRRLDRNLPWATLGGSTDVIRPIGLDGDASGIARKNTALCTHFMRGTQDGTVGQFYIDKSTNTQFNVRFMVPRTIVTTLDEWKAYLDANAVMLCYELVEPITVQLTPQEILALSGENTLYSDTGDTSVTGKADLAAVVAKLQETIKTLLEG